MAGMNMIGLNTPVIPYQYLPIVIVNKAKYLSDHQQTQLTNNGTTSVYTLQCLVCVCVPIL